MFNHFFGLPTGDSKSVCSSTSIAERERHNLITYGMSRTQYQRMQAAKKKAGISLAGHKRRASMGKFVRMN